MTQTRDAERGSSARGPRDRRGGSGGIALFVRQIVAELRKVVRPTRDELFAYVSVVLVFVCAIMFIVSGLDVALGRIVLWAFGGGDIVPATWQDWASLGPFFLLVAVTLVWAVVTLVQRLTGRGAKG